MFKTIFNLTLLLFFHISYADSINYEKMHIDILNKNQNNYSIEFINLIQETNNQLQYKSDLDKVIAINKIVNNHIQYGKDIFIWNTNDYWATPFETISQMTGDCEDFAIIKYFLLTSLGVDHNKLKFTFGNLKYQNENHLVLNYYEHENSEALIMDNITPFLLTNSERDDFITIFQFNLHNHWIGKNIFSKNEIKNQQFTNLLNKINQEKLYNFK